MSYRMDSRGSISVRGRNSSILHRIQIVSGVYPASHAVGTGGLFLRVKEAGYEADPSPVSSTEVRHGGTIHLHFPIRLHGVVFK
jgi:hypothetical protein